ncbi:zinc finger protein Xfin isoform X12 [Nilaparvata lugens]|uniref:zinc finger protein Xfin isoform X12 n=1 Tax=Nilaparvata lugens TaxID=108931 RepID=UPI00193CBA0C|nr:zinc finger protein Xfin isoform X12 [Nilaparvata lugens]
MLPCCIQSHLCTLQFFTHMICKTQIWSGKIAKVELRRVDDISKSESKIYSQIEIVKHESPFEQIDIEMKNEPSHSNTAIHQIKREKQEDGFAEHQLTTNNIKQEPITSEEAPTTTQIEIVKHESPFEQIDIEMTNEPSHSNTAIHRIKREKQEDGFADLQLTTNNIKQEPITSEPTTTQIEIVKHESPFEKIDIEMKNEPSHSNTAIHQIKREKQEDGFAEHQLTTNNIKQEPITSEEAPTTNQIEIVKHESPFEQIDIEMTNEPSHSNTAIHQIKREKQEDGFAEHQLTTNNIKQEPITSEEAPTTTQIEIVKHESPFEQIDIEMKNEPSHSNTAIHQIKREKQEDGFAEHQLTTNNIKQEPITSKEAPTTTQIEIVKHESPFEQIDIEMKNEPSHSNTAIHQIEIVKHESPFEQIDIEMKNEPSHSNTAIHQIEIVKHESPFEQIDIEMKNEPSHSNTAIHQIKREKQEDGFAEHQLTTNNIKQEPITSKEAPTTTQIEIVKHESPFEQIDIEMKNEPSHSNTAIHQIEIVKHESPFEQIDIEMKNEPSHSNTAIHQIKREKQEDGFAELQLTTDNIKQEPITSEKAPTTTQMATVAVNSSQEPAPECSTAFAPTDNDFSQQHYLIPGYNLIFINEEDSQDGEDISEEVDFGAVKSEAEMWPSISGTANATEVGGLDAHSISPVEKCTEPTVAGKKTKLYSCADCSYETTWISALKKHIRTHTGETPFSCNFCDYKCAILGNLKVHIRSHTDEKPFSCNFCDYKCAASGNLKIHIRSHTGEKPFSCKFCDYKCASSGHLKIHIRTHTGEKPFSCNFCDYKCASSGELNGHIRRHTSKKPFSCNFCDYKFASLSELKSHIRTHTGEKPFSCNFCDYKCATSSNLKVHIRSHTGEKPFSCNFCDHKCAHLTDLKKHIRTHTGVKPFSCEFCDFKCSKKSNLKSHLRSHTGVKPFSCEFCDFKCSQKSSLKLHLRTHTNEKPFSCNFCDYKSTNSGGLKSHLRTHTGEKPFSCEFCDFKCSQKSSLKLHLRTHTNEKPFSCNFCDYKCASSIALKRHIRTHTGE